MRVHIERVEDGRYVHCSTVGCRFATFAESSTRAPYVVAPIFDVQVDHGPLGRTGFEFSACEDHLRSFAVEVSQQFDKALETLPAPRTPGR